MLYITGAKNDSMRKGNLHKNDILFMNRGEIGKLALVDEEFEGANLNSQIAYLRVQGDEIQYKYLLYFLSSRYIENFILSLEHGSTLTQFPIKHILNIEVLRPSKSEQKAIADYLDRKTAVIDSLIAKKERQIDLLQEQRVGVINHAVTKGLNPHAPMKDSGIPWLGQIPAHWQTGRAKQVSSIFVPQRNKPDLNTKTGIPWITMEDLVNSAVEKSTVGYLVSEQAFNQAGSKTLQANSVIASCVGNFGVSSVNTVPVVINQQLQAYIPQRINPWYLKYLVTISSTYFEKVATAATLAYVNQERFGDLPILLPSEDEQTAIVQFIEKQLGKFDNLIGNIRQMIELFTEYRTAVISAAVTGKIDVRHS
jgi:type I restriction enzyme S subunit